jgi:steroid delta-isomerase-like uncharacterized protein
MSQSDLLQLLDRHLRAENAHDLEGTLATLTADCEFVDHALGMRWRGRTGAAEHYTMWWNAFDIEVTGERLHLAADSAVAETTWRGTHVGEFLGIAPTGRPVELTIAVFVEFGDGLMAGERFYWDTARLARQLGVPAPTGVREDEAVASV